MALRRATLILVIRTALVILTVISVLGLQYGGATWSVSQAVTALVGPVLYSETVWITKFIPSRTLWAAFWWVVKKVSD